MPACPSKLAPDPIAPLPCTARTAITLAMLALHALAIYGLMQLAPARPALGTPTPIFAELIVPPAPEPLRLTPPPPPPPPPTPTATPKPAPRRPVIAAKEPRRLPEPAFVAPPEPPQPRKIVEPVPIPPEPAPSARPPDPTPRPALAAAPASPTPAPPAPAPSPAPKDLSIRAVEYLTLPVLRYPPASRRLLEEGRVDVRVLVDARGAPRETVVVRSSGYPRLDEAALATVRATRFKPYAENGVAMPFWVVMPLIFELES